MPSQPGGRPDDLYFVNAYVDAFFVGLASFACFLWFRYAVGGYSTLQVNENAIYLATVLGWIGSWPHFSATAWRLYGSREHVRAYPLTAWLAPALALLAGAACFVYPVSFAPFFIKLFVLWSPWHFSLQAFGITLIYARRAGVAVPSGAKRALACFFVSSFLVQYSEAENALSHSYLYAISYPQLRLPAFTPLACKAVMFASLAAAAWGLWPSVKAAGRLPLILVLPVLTQYLWFVHGARDLSFQLLLPLFHGLQYLLIAFALELRVRALTHPSPSFAASVKAGGKWMAANFAAGALLFAGLPWLLARAGFDLAFATLVILAAVSVHHYFVDGVIWKLGREAGASPLFGNVAHAWRKP